MRIPVSPKHGVNPSLIQCYLCGESKGVALLGKLKGDVEAPRHVCLDKEPCDTCKEHMKTGVILIGVLGTFNPKYDDEPYRTGEFLVVTEDFVKRNITGAIGDQILKARVSFIDQRIAKEIILQSGGPTPEGSSS